MRRQNGGMTEEQQRQNVLRTEVRRWQDRLAIVVPSSLVALWQGNEGSDGDESEER